MALNRRGLWHGLLHTALWVLLVFSMSLPDAAKAQTNGDALLEEITSAFTRGDSRELLRHSANRLEVSLFETSTLFSRGQAMYVLDSFFRQFPPRRTELREPVKTNDSWFTAGRYWYTSSDEPLRVYVGLRRNGEAWELRELRIDQEPRE